MRKLIAIASLIALGLSGLAYAHSGKTDKNGGHKCSAKSKKKGLCSGYHYHNKDGAEYGHSHDGEAKPHKHD